MTAISEKKGRGRILVVDDEASARSGLERLLQQEGFSVKTAADGTIALKVAADFAPDVVVTDLKMPQMDGMALLRQLREQDVGIPVIVATAFGDVSSAVTAMRAGADDYLTKPFAFAELLVRVKALLRRGTVSQNSTVRIADLEIDRLTQQVRRGGKRIEFTPKEYSLLEYLATQPGRVFSRTMIVEHVWDQGFEGLTNIVDVYVRHLREKLDAPYPLKLIHTVRGVGYFVSEKPEA